MCIDTVCTSVTMQPDHVLSPWTRPPPPCCFLCLQLCSKSLALAAFCSTPHSALDNLY